MTEDNNVALKYPEYHHDDDAYWAVNRNFFSVSNYTYGPIADWNESNIRNSVDVLREEILRMISQRVKDRERFDEAIAQAKLRGAPCKYSCEAQAFEIEIRQLKAQLAQAKRETVKRCIKSIYVGAGLTDHELRHVSLLDKIVQAIKAIGEDK